MDNSFDGETVSLSLSPEETALEQYHELGMSMKNEILNHLKKYHLPPALQSEMDISLETGIRERSIRKIEKSPGAHSLRENLHTFSIQQGYESVAEYFASSRKDNLIATYFFRMLQIQRGILELARLQDYLDMEVLSRVGTELMSKMYLVINAESGYHVLSMMEDKKIRRMSRKLPHTKHGDDNSTYIKKFISNEENQISKDPFFESNGLDVQKLLRNMTKMEKSIRKVFFEKVYEEYGLSTDKSQALSFFRESLLNDYVHSNPAQLSFFFSESRGYPFCLNNPFGNNDFEHKARIPLNYWVRCVDKIFQEVFSYFDLNNEKLTSLHEDVRSWDIPPATTPS